MLIALADVESNGLLLPQDGKSVATKLHGIAISMSDGRKFSCADQAGYDGRIEDVCLKSGKVWKATCKTSIKAGIVALLEADMIVGHNWAGYDHRLMHKLFPTLWGPIQAKVIDTLIWSRLLYPVISKDGPNTHKVPGQLKTRHSLEAWGYRLNNFKDKGFDPGDWQTWSEEMQDYMLQDVDSLETLFKWLTNQKPTPMSSDIEHGFATIIRRQEAWGFTIDYEGMLALQADLVASLAELEADLISRVGEWWEPGKTTQARVSRRMTLKDYPDVVLPRWNAKGERLSKDYVGPPKCHFEAGAPYTPIERVQFQPGSREHVRKLFGKKYGWKPRKFTDKGTAQVDDDVLRSLNYPEAPMLADYYEALKIIGYVSTGNQAWIKCAVEEGRMEWRIHGQVLTIGTYTFRASHFKPNMGQIPTRSERYGHRCRALFVARPGFTLVGFDGSGMQLRLLAHYLSYFDGGAYLRAAFIDSAGKPHEFMRDTVGVDIMGEGEEGKKKGKTLNYALCFGGGIPKLGSIIEPHASLARQKELGMYVKEKMLPVWGTAFDDLNTLLKATVEKKGGVVGLDGRFARCPKPHAAKATLLQMGEGVVMKKSLILLDDWLQAEGLRPGVGPDGICRPELADYEFCANVHDEAQADVREAILPVYEKYALRCVAEAGEILNVRCPLKSDVKSGSSWVATH